MSIALPDLTPEQEVTLLAENFERSYPHEIIAWAAMRYGAGLAVATGFGPEGIVILHILSQVAPQTTVFYLDTGLFFPETYQLRDQLQQKLGLTFTQVTPSLSLEEQEKEYGANLWETNPDLCCRLRKVIPLRAYLATKQAWVTAIRRSQTTQRAHAKAIECDKTNGVVKINPLINWSQEQVWTYLHLFELPYNPLHERGYPSIGCAPCTRPVAQGADPRSGRWVGHQKVECGLHVPGDGG
jgi:phosphoadenosine phosphosulfate reductase